VGGKLVQTLDSGVGWGWGWVGEIYTGMGMGMGNFLWGWRIFHGDGMGMEKILWGWGGNGDNFIYRVTLYKQAHHVVPSFAVTG